MCGIFGIARFGGIVDSDVFAICDLADALRRRGPDGEGFFVSGDVAFGMRRLSIIDLDGGWQPFHSEDRRVVAVVNGEIYNHNELRRQLAAKGHTFSSRSDCEVVVHMYEEFGLDFLPRLRGMFAIALLDTRIGTLFLARDKMGEKPLAIHEGEGMVAFASEASALVSAGLVPLKLSPVATVDYLHWGFVPDPGCIIEGVRKVTPGSFVRICLTNRTVHEHRYWRLSEAAAVEGNPVEVLSAAIDEVGRLTIQSDVPIGVGLSSGIDSSAIAVLAKRHSAQPVYGVTVGYEGHAWQDETALAETFANEIQLPLVKVTVSLDEVVQAFPSICIDRDDPLSDIAGSSYRALMRGCSDHGIRVLLTGMGGDELFWGYSWHRDARRACDRKSRLLAGHANILDYLRMTAPPMSITWALYWLRNGGGLLSGYRDWKRDLSTRPDRLVFWDASRSVDFMVAEHHLHRVAGPELIAGRFDAARHFSNARYWRDLDTYMTELLCDTYLVSNGFVIVDRQGMAASIEGRSPLADATLAETVVGLRKTGSDLGLGHKAWLRAAFEGFLPERVMNLRKRGFSPPWRSWLKAIYSTHGSCLEDGYLTRAGILSPAGAFALSKPFDILRSPTPLSYAALVLEMWARELHARSIAGPPHQCRDMSMARQRLSRAGPTCPSSVSHDRV